MNKSHAAWIWNESLHAEITENGLILTALGKEAKSRNLSTSLFVKGEHAFQKEEIKRVSDFLREMADALIAKE